MLCAKVYNHAYIVRQISTKVNDSYFKNHRKRVGKVTLSEGMMERSEKQIDLMVEYVEMLMKWFRKGETAGMNPIICDLERIADEYLKEANHD